MNNKTRVLKIVLDGIISERGYDIWCVAGKDGIARILKDELDQILKACKESGLMFTQTTRSPQDVPLPESMIRAGVKSWEFKEIIEDIDV